MDFYTWCKKAFEQYGATLEQLSVWVTRGKITEQEYQDITSQEYIAH